jgi:hypothetical protein
MSAASQACQQLPAYIKLKRQLNTLRDRIAPRCVYVCVCARVHIRSGVTYAKLCFVSQVWIHIMRECATVCLWLYLCLCMCVCDSWDKKKRCAWRRRLIYHKHTHTHTHTHTHYMYVCMHVCMYVCIYTYSGIKEKALLMAEEALLVAHVQVSETLRH